MIEETAKELESLLGANLLKKDPDSVSKLKMTDDIKNDALQKREELRKVAEEYRKGKISVNVLNLGELGKRFNEIRFKIMAALQKELMRRKKIIDDIETVQINHNGKQYDVFINVNEADFKMSLRAHKKSKGIPKQIKEHADIYRNYAMAYSDEDLGNVIVVRPYSDTKFGTNYALLGDSAKMLKIDYKVMEEFENLIIWLNENHVYHYEIDQLDSLLFEVDHNLYIQKIVIANYGRAFSSNNSINVINDDYGVAVFQNELIKDGIYKKPEHYHPRAVRDIFGNIQAYRYVPDERKSAAEGSVFDVYDDRYTGTAEDMRSQDIKIEPEQYQKLKAMGRQTKDGLVVSKRFKDIDKIDEVALSKPILSIADINSELIYMYMKNRNSGRFYYIRKVENPDESPSYIIYSRKMLPGTYVAGIYANGTSGIYYPEVRALPNWKVDYDIIKDRLAKDFSLEKFVQPLSKELINQRTFLISRFKAGRELFERLIIDVLKKIPVRKLNDPSDKTIYPISDRFDIRLNMSNFELDNLIRASNVESYGHVRIPRIVAIKENMGLKSSGPMDFDRLKGILKKYNIQLNDKDRELFNKSLSPVQFIDDKIEQLSDFKVTRIVDRSYRDPTKLDENRMTIANERSLGTQRQQLDDARKEVVRLTDLSELGEVRLRNIVVFERRALEPWDSSMGPIPIDEIRGLHDGINKLMQNGVMVNNVSMDNIRILRYNVDADTYANPGGPGSSFHDRDFNKEYVFELPNLVTNIEDDVITLSKSKLFDIANDSGKTHDEIIKNIKRYLFKKTRMSRYVKMKDNPNIDEDINEITLHLWNDRNESSDNISFLRVYDPELRRHKLVLVDDTDISSLRPLVENTFFSEIKDLNLVGDKINTIPKFGESVFMRRYPRESDVQNMVDHVNQIIEKKLPGIKFEGKYVKNFTDVGEQYIGIDVFRIHDLDQWKKWAMNIIL